MFFNNSTDSLFFSVPELVNLVTNELCYRDLMALSKLSVVCARSAQRQLFRVVHVVVPPNDDADDTLCDGELVLRNPALAAHVRVLEIRPKYMWALTDVVSFAFLSRVLAACPAVVELRLESVHWYSEPDAAVPPLDCSVGRSLTRLHLTNVKTFRGSPLELLWTDRRWSELTVSGCELQILHTDTSVPPSAVLRPLDQLTVCWFGRLQSSRLDPVDRVALLPLSRKLTVTYDKRTTHDLTYVIDVVKPLLHCLRVEALWHHSSK